MAAVTGIAAACVNQFDIQANGIHNFHHGGGQVGGAHELIIRGTQLRFGTEDFGIAFAAKEDDSFIKGAQSGDFGGFTHTAEGVGGDAVEEFYIYGVKAAIKGDAFYRNLYRPYKAIRGLKATSY